MSQRHAVVTGASRGIGAAIATALAEECKLTVLARDLDALERRMRELDLSGVFCAACDVGDEASVDEALERAVAAHGPVDILVNNAGIAESAPLEKSDLAQLERHWRVNVAGVYACTRAVIPGMKAIGRGRIINIASTAGLRGYAYVGAYVASKHAVVGLTRAWAREFAKTEITVNAICPGYTETEMLDRTLDKITATTGSSREDARASLLRHNPQGRMITPDEVAAAVRWLCQDSTASITGHCLPLDGGETS